MDNTLIDIDVGDAVELQAVSEGNYTLVCRSIETNDKGNGPYIIMRCDIVGEPTSKSVTNVMMLPQESDDPKQQNSRKLALKRACEAFGVDIGPPLDLTDFVNQEAEAYLTVEETEQYGRQNRLRRYVSGPGSSDTNRANDLALG